MQYIKCLIFSPCSDSDSESESTQRSSSPGNPLRGNWRTTVQFWCLVVLLSAVGSRVSSLIVLEFSLRAVSAWASAGQVSFLNTWIKQLVALWFKLPCVHYIHLFHINLTYFHHPSCIFLSSGCQGQRPRPAPHPESVHPGLRLHLYFGLPPSGGSTQLPQLVFSSCSELGTGKPQPQSVEACGHTLPTT